MKHFCSSAGGKVWVYLLFLALGLSLGLIAGGETIKRIYFGTNSNSMDRVGSSSSVKNSGFTGANKTPADITSSRSNAIVAATRAIAPCVVGIVVTQIQVVRDSYYRNEFLDFFFNPEMTPQYQKIESIGSGFVILKDGVILTNYHVVQNAAELYVNFSNGKRLEGKIIGVDARSDLAVISVEKGDFQRVDFGNSDETMTGEWAIAIGNPFLNFINDVHPTVTVGVISALNRNFAPSEGVYYQGMIQTDAAINPGNSGGPLVNALGEVIGINTFIFTGSNSNKGSIGIGFAIPINRARRVAEELIKYGMRRQVWTGISVQDLNRSIALSLGYNNTEGVVVASVQKGSPGERASLQAGDIIKQMGNRIIQSHLDIDGFFLDYFVGDKVQIVVSRKGKVSNIELTLSEFSGADK
jgi:serine protease Do